MDAFFKEKYTETNNLANTWKAFKKYFKQKGLAKPFIALKQQLVKNDLQRQQLVLKRVYFHQNTVIIDLSLGQKGGYPKSQNQGKQH